MEYEIVCVRMRLQGYFAKLMAWKLIISLVSVERVINAEFRRVGIA